MGISPGHLARSFKTEMGVSLVEYRNRLRVERFFATVDRGGSNLQEAAQEAGFGSYAQFHRVFRKLLGTTPREYLTGRRAQALEPEWASRAAESAE
jgi:AraC-like DNA-binding protein